MRTSHLWVLAAAATILATSGAAHSDVVQPDSCPTSAVGKPCDHAGPAYDQPGVCVASTCSHTSFDGQYASYPCAECRPTGEKRSTSGGATSRWAWATGFTMVALGLAALAWSRRRRQ